MRTDPSTIWAASRENLLTTMGSSELADALPVAIRVNSFFSAKVAESRILDKLREVSDAYNSGSLGHSEARVMIKDFLGATRQKVPMKDYLGQTKMYYPPESDKSVQSDQSDMSNLASTARLDLIINQQEAMFSAVGQYAAGMDPDVKERFPCWEYHVGPNARPDHAALDGLILNKDDEFWANHTPPWDFNCNCFLTNAEEPEPTSAAGKMLASTEQGWRVNGIDYSGAAPETGYMFNPAEALRAPDLETVPEAYRDAVKEQLAAEFGDQVQIQDDGSIEIVPSAASDSSESYTRKQLAGMSEDELRAIAREKALAYYPKSGIDFGNTPVADAVDSLLAQKRSKASLIDDVYSMQKRLKNLNS